MFTKRVALPVLLFAGLAGGLVACGDDGPDTPTTTAPADTAPEATTTPESTGPESTGPESTDPESTDPESIGPTMTGPGDSTAGTADLPTEESAADLVGLTEDEAEAAAEELGWTVRVTRRDGEDLPATMDLRDNRVNVEVTDGEVTAILNIG